jgi:simple sugar transport system ATP-binding protein
MIYDEIVKATERGCAVVLISADLDEILRLADRVVVMYEGESVSDQDIDQVDRKSLGLLMTGVRKGISAA